MTNQETKNRFAQILADAQAKAEAQANGKKVATPKQVVAKPIQPVQPDVQVPVQAKPIPTATFRAVTKDNLIARYKSFAVRELSTTTIADLVGEVPTTDLRIIHYSDKCVVVVGNTKPKRDKLKSLGGKFNPWLKCGEGWVFPKYKEASIRSEFSL